MYIHFLCIQKILYFNFQSYLKIGNIVYHGPTKEARDYFARAKYDLPEGESLADWLIDISSGDLDPTMKVSDNLLMSMRGSSIANFEMTDAKRLLHNRERYALDLFCHTYGIWSLISKIQF